MSSEKERRKGMLELEDRVDKLNDNFVRLISWMGSEFGYANGTKGNVNRRLDELRDVILKQNGRIGSLENWRWFAGGGVAMIGAVAAIVIPILFVGLHDIKTGVDEHVKHPEYHQGLSGQLDLIKQYLSEWRNSGAR